MHGAAWIEFFQHVPVHQHDNLALMTMTGSEVILQTIIALEAEYVIVRGRTAGSQDGGRLLMLPYDKIDYVGFQRKVLEPEAQAMFGNTATAAPLQTGAASAPAPDAVAAAAVSEQAQPAAATAAADITSQTAEQVKKQAQPSKSILLARLRARLTGDGKPAAK